MAKNLASPEVEEPGEQEEGEDQNAISGDAAEAAYSVGMSLAQTMFYDEEHIQKVVQAVQSSKDPSQVIGQVIGQIVLMSYTKAAQAGVNADDRVWLAEGGVLASMIDEVQTFFEEMGVKVDENVAAKKAVEVVENSPQAMGEQQAPPQGAPAPQGANMAAPPQPQQMGAMQ